MPLKNAYSESLELASLLVHIDMRNPKVAESSLLISFLILLVSSCLSFVDFFVLICGVMIE